MRSLLAALAAVLVALPANAAAEERITRFVSDVQVERDSSLDIAETIDVLAEGDRINHGIFRDFPTRYRGRNGSQVRIGFTLLGVTRDGDTEPAAIEPLSNGVRIRIGDAQKTVAPGDHRYVIRYRTTRQIGHFTDYDELYWNVTGNGWVFPINVAEAHVRLPAPAKFGQRAVYTGAQGSTAHNAEVFNDRAGEIDFRTTQPLDSYEGLTVAVAWPKGVVADPDRGSRLRWWLADDGPPFVGALALLGLAGYIFVAWKRAGRNPRPGTVVPLFTPADDLDPPAMRYVWKMRTDNRAFAAALVDLGVRGHIRLIEERGGFFKTTQRRIERLDSATPLPAAEQAMIDKLLQPGETIVMDNEKHAYFSSAMSALDAEFKKQYEGKLFNRNWGWALAGIALFAAALWLTAAAVVAATGVLDLKEVLLAIGAILTTVLLLLLVQSTKAVGKCLMIIGIFVFGGLALAVGFPVVGAAFQTGWLLPLALPLLGLPLVISAFWWIAAPTREGRAVLDRIAGFRQYLSIAERDRLDRMTAPNDTPELFERYLPFAIALGVENHWAERFQSVLAAAAAQGQQRFAWYSGSNSPWNDASGFTHDVGSSLASTVGSASTAPGSSSGSGGGGSSGGGGGGGGGGGW